MNNINLIKEIIEDILKDTTFFLVELDISKDEKNINIYLDGDNGIDINTCALFNKKINKQIENKDIFKLPYIIQVSSPGIDRPLKFKRQYKRNIGRILMINLKNGTKISGNLINMDEEGIILKTENNELNIGFNDIDKAMVKI